MTEADGAKSEHLAKVLTAIQAMRCELEFIEPLGMRGTRHERRKYTIVAIDDQPTLQSPQPTQMLSRLPGEISPVQMEAIVRRMQAAAGHVFRMRRPHELRVRRDRFYITVTCLPGNTWGLMSTGEYAVQQARLHFGKDVKAGVRAPLAPKPPNAILEAVRLYKADLATARSAILGLLYRRQKALGVTRKRREKILAINLQRPLAPLYGTPWMGRI